MKSLANISTGIAIIAGTTVAAVHFDNPTLLWWYILVLFI